MIFTPLKTGDSGKTRISYSFWMKKTTLICIYIRAETQEVHYKIVGFDIHAGFNAFSAPALSAEHKKYSVRFEARALSH